MKWLEIINEVNMSAMLLLLSSKSECPQIGEEQGKFNKDGISLFFCSTGGKSGSYRFVYAIDGKIVSAIQIMSSGTGGVVTNAITDPEYVRKGYATKLYRMAEKKLGKISNRDDQSDDGKLWTKSLNENFKELIIDDIDTMINKLNPVAHQKLHNGIAIFKGMRSMPSSSFITNPLENRISPYAKNGFYSMLMSNLDVWKEYPQRNNSFVCTTDLKRAKEYGDVYVVIPIDNPIIGVCCNYDLWDSFPYMKDFYIKDANDFNVQLMNYFIFANKFGFDIDLDRIYRDYSYFCSAINMLSEDNNFYEYVMKNPIKSFKEFINGFDIISDMMNPTANNFKKTNLTNFNYSGRISSRELWFNGRAAFFSYLKNHK